MEHGFTWLAFTYPWEPIATGMVVVVVLLLMAFGIRGRFANTEEAIEPQEGVSLKNVGEVFVESMSSMAESVIGHGYEKYVPLLATFFIFILLSNLLGLIPGFSPGTSDFRITFALGLVSFCAYNAYGVREQGLGSYLRHFMGPMLALAPLMIIVELLSHGFRPVSLGIRLYANMFADHAVLAIFTDLTKFVVPVVFYVLGAFVCVVQAFVFTMLSAIYISLAVAHDH